MVLPFTSQHAPLLVISKAIDTKTTRYIAAKQHKLAYIDLPHTGNSSNKPWNKVFFENNLRIEMMLWPTFDRLYIAAGSDIYISYDGCESINPPIYTGTSIIRAAYSHEYSDYRVVWFVGDNNLIVSEINPGHFISQTGPDEHFTAITINNGILYAGNGTSLWKNTNLINTKQNWSKIRDFSPDKIIHITISDTILVELLSGSVVQIPL